MPFVGHFQGEFDDEVNEIVIYGRTRYAVLHGLFRAFVAYTGGRS